MERSKASKWDVIYELIFKEFGSCLFYVWYIVVFWVNPHKYDLDPIEFKPANAQNQTAKVVLFIHGAHGHPSASLPLAKKLQDEGIDNVYTVSHSETDEAPVPTETLSAKIDEISLKYFKSGYENVEFFLVGFSLGAIIGSKFIWRELKQEDHRKISMMISIGGRLKYVENKFSPFYEELKPEIEKTYEKMANDSNKVELYTIWGDNDELIPEESAHILGNKNKQFTVAGWGHTGLLLAPDTHKQITRWIKKKL